MPYSKDCICVTAFLYLLVIMSHSGLIGIAAVEDIKLERKLLGSGFHRDLETTITLPSTVKSKHIQENCGLLLFETLPSGVYADPFQLQSLEPFKGPQVLFTKEVNVEAAEYQSVPLELYTFLSVSGEDKEINKDNGELILSVSLPIHARYHSPSADPLVTHATITILNPGLYSNCSKTTGRQGSFIAPCDASSLAKCIWHYQPYVKRSSQIQFDLPVGQQKHRPLVVLVTLCVSVAVSAILVKVICTVQDSHMKKS